MNIYLQFFFVMVGCTSETDPRYVYTAPATGTILNASVSADGDQIFDVSPVLDGEAGYWEEEGELRLQLQSVQEGVNIIYHHNTSSPRDYTFAILNTITIASSCEVFWDEAVVESFEVEDGFIVTSLLADYTLVSEEAPVECRQPFIFEMEVEGTEKLSRVPAPSGLSYE